MKNYLLGIITTIAIYAIFGFIIETNELEAHKKEWVITTDFLTLQEGITKEETL